jgi:hypothetical protein
MNASRQTRSLFVCLVVLICSSLGVAQNTINVPADQPTIQAGIDAAAAGDTVLVAPGTYVERINFKGKAITVKSSSGSSVTIIDGNRLGSVVTFASGESRSSVLDGFTVRNGLDNLNGGGVTIERCSPTIQNNLIMSNQGLTGIGIMAHFASPLIQNNTISFNRPSSGGGGNGGGIAIVGSSTAQVIGNKIIHNVAQGDGGGIVLYAAGTALVSGNSITLNATGNRGGGLAVEDDSGSTIVNNVVANNSDGQSPLPGQTRGVFFGAGGSGTDFVNNTVLDTVYFDTSIVIAENNIFSSSGTTAAISCANFVQPILRNNDIFNVNNIAPVGWCAGIVGANNNANSDPLLLDPADGDYRPTFSSIAIDSGDNAAPNLPTLDAAGNARIADGNGDGTSTIDMGAYEVGVPIVAARAEFTPSSYNFPDQNVNVQSASQQITLTNTGSVPAQLVSFTVTGDFIGVNRCPALLAPGQSCSVLISFVPSTPRLRNGLVSFTGNFSSFPPRIALSGTGLGPNGIFAPSSLSFGNVFVGATGSGSSVFTNTGNQTLDFAGVHVSSGFTQSNDCPASLIVGASCTFTVRFSPAVVGFASGSVSVSSNSLNGFALALTGMGMALPPIQLSATQLDFGHFAIGSTVTKTVMLTVNGSTPQHISGISLFGPAISGFSMSHDCAPIMVGGQSCEITISLTPTAVGPRFGNLQVVTDAGTQFVSVQGFGSGAGLAISGQFDSGGTLIGSPDFGSLNMYNFGDQPLHYSMAVSGDFSVLSDCPNPLPAGSQCPRQVEFRPTVPGVRTGTITFTDDALDSPQTVALTEIGLDYSLAISPSSVAVESGKTAVYSVTASDLGGEDYFSPIDLSCTTNAPAATCYLDQAYMATKQVIGFKILTTTKQGKSGGTLPGMYTVTIQGAAASNHSASTSLVIKK